MAMHFENLSIGINTASAPKWQRDIMARVCEEYEQEAIKAGAMFAKEYAEICKGIQPGFEATAAMAVMRRIPRFAYIKNIKDNEGKEYDAEINTLLHTVAFIQV